MEGGESVTRCKKYRLLAELTQTEAAKRIGRTSAVLSFYETGARKLPIPIALRMAKVYGCKWTDLYEEGEDGFYADDFDGKGHSATV